MKLIAFPLQKRTGKIRATAANMLAKSTDRHAAFYRDQVTRGLRRQYEKMGLPEDERRAQLTAFWQAVQAEMLRLIRNGDAA